VEKLKCLRNGNWLNDEVINFYMAMLKEHDSQRNRTARPSHFFNTFFFVMLYAEKKYTFDNAIKQWTNNFDVFAQNKLFIPIHMNNHWVMAVIYVQTKQIALYDSAAKAAFMEKRLITSLLMQWLQDEAISRGKTPVEWTILRGYHVPQQRNGFDCGMFTIMAADFIANNLPLTYEQKHMPTFRLKIGAAILNGTIPY
jgi:Ulp1 family protease